MKQTIATQAIERVRPYEVLTGVIDEEPVFPGWLLTDDEDCCTPGGLHAAGHGTRPVPGTHHRCSTRHRAGGQRQPGDQDHRRVPTVTSGRVGRQGIRDVPRRPPCAAGAAERVQFARKRIGDSPGE